MPSLFRYAIWAIVKVAPSKVISPVEVTWMFNVLLSAGAFTITVFSLVVPFAIVASLPAYSAHIQT